ncbi:MAG: arsenic transporter [Oscillospiraceae bacterium]|jgi:Na+/H+ antiporter NhaD/arsenite permease-like protein|nr:arsenic transporter [Oscillospiraceae bacterium]
MSFFVNLIGGRQMLVALILFGLTYLGMLFFSRARAYIALGSAALFVLLGILPWREIPGAVNWNVILMIAGTMGTVSLFIASKMPAKMADWLIDKSPNMKWAVIWLSVFAGVISAFVDNVATVLMIAPVAIDIAKKLKISPVPSIIAIAIASNLQGAATLVGDTTSILLAGEADMNFLDFFFFKPAGAAHGGLGLFWIVQVAFLAATGFLFLFFRREKQPIHLEERTLVKDYIPTVLLLSTIVALILVSFLPQSIPLPKEINGIICMAVFLIGVMIYGFRSDMIKIAFKEMDYFTLLLLAGLFVIIKGITAAGAIDAIGEVFKTVSAGNVFLLYTILVWFSVLISAFVDNIPYVATMLPVVTLLATKLGVSPYILYFGLLSGATLGGNLTPIGASANIAGLGILRREGHHVKAKQFMKMSVPYTLTAVLVGYLLVWFCWKP